MMRSQILPLRTKDQSQTYYLKPETRVRTFPISPKKWRIKTAANLLPGVAAFYKTTGTGRREGALSHGCEAH